MPIKKKTNPRKRCKGDFAGQYQTNRKWGKEQVNQKPQQFVFKTTTICGLYSSAASFVFIYRHLFRVSLAPALYFVV